MHNESATIRRAPGFLAALCAVGIAAEALAGGTASIEALAIEGDTAPSGGTYDLFRSPLIGADGTVAFSANILGVPGSQVTRIFTVCGGSITMVASQGQPAPGAPGTTFDNNFITGVSWAMSDDGTLSFRNQLEGASVVQDTNTGIWTAACDGAQGPTTLIRRKGDSVAALVSGAMIGDLTGVAIDGARTLLDTQLVGMVNQNNDRAILLDDDGALSLVLRSGDPAPGIGNDTTIAPGKILVNAQGAIVADALLSGPDIDTTNNAILYGGTVYAPSPAIREGDAAPGLAGGAEFDRFEATAINGAGQIAFVGVVRGDTPSDFRRSLWRIDTGALVLIADGLTSAVPGTPAPTRYLNFPTVEIADDGAVLALANLTGTGVNSANREAVIAYAPDGTPRLLARLGSPMPGVDNAATVTNILHVALSPGGHAVVQARLAGPGITGANNEALWIAQPGGQLELVVRDGDSIDIDNDPAITDLRTVTAIPVSTTPPALDGTLPMRLEFGTLSGLFLVNADPATPCPGDANGDGMVDLADLNLVLANFGSGPGGDTNGDGNTDLADLNLVLANFGAACP